jgi:hypothetical protein
VTLNNISISAGSLSYQLEIERLKKQLNDDITSLDPLKIKAIELRRKKEQTIAALNTELVNLEKDKMVEMTSITKQFDQFRADQYRVKALMTIELQKVIFDFNQKVMITKQRAQNKSEDIAAHYENRDFVKAINEKYKSKDWTEAIEDGTQSVLNKLLS